MGSVLISTRRLLPVCWADFSPVLGPAVGDRQALEVLLPSHLGPWGPKDLGDVRFSQPSPALDFSVFFFLHLAASLDEGLSEAPSLWGLNPRDTAVDPQTLLCLFCPHPQG